MYKLIKLDNKQSAGTTVLNKTAEFSFYGVCFYFDSIQSSRVKSITFDKQEQMVVETKNSTYTFRKD